MGIPWKTITHLVGHAPIPMLISGGSRNSKRGFPLVVDPRRGGLGAQPPAAEQVLILKGMQSNEILLNYISYS